MTTAQFINENPQTNEKLLAQDLSNVSFDTVRVNVLFEEIEVEVKADTTQSSATFTSPSEFSTIFTPPEELNIIVERVASVSVIEDNDILLVIAAENVPKYAPIAVTLSDEGVIATSSNLDHFNRYIGISLSATVIGGLIPVKIAGTITDPSFNYDVDKEIYLSSSGTLTQDPSPSPGIFLEEIANVLTSDTILIDRNKPVEL